MLFAKNVPLFITILSVSVDIVISDDVPEGTLAALASAYVNLMCKNKDKSCHFSVDRESDNSPIFINTTDESIINPDVHRQFNIGENEKVYIQCLGEGNTFDELFENTYSGLFQPSFIAATCVCGDVFKHDCSLYETRELKCIHPNSVKEIKYPPNTYYTYDGSQTKPNSMILIKFSYATTMTGKLKTPMDAFYLPSKDLAVFVVNRLQDMDTQAKNDMVPNGSDNPYYDLKTQKQSIAHQLHMDSQLINNHDHFVAAYLAPVNTMPNVVGVLAANSYYNKAPQWSRINGNWGILEKFLVNDLANVYSDLIVQTGTHESYRYDYGKKRFSEPLYLHYDSNSNTKQKLIPMYFYKIVYSLSSKYGSVFVVVNSPYLSYDDDSKYYAEKVCGSSYHWAIKRPDWIRCDDWKRPYYYSSGYSFYCSIPNFLEKTKVPFIDEKMVGISSKFTETTETNSC